MPKYDRCKWEMHGGYGILRDASGREVGLLKMLEEPEKQIEIPSPAGEREEHQHDRNHERANRIASAL